MTLKNYVGRLVRLIPATHTHIRTLFNHRLPSEAGEALAEWNAIISNVSPLWTSIPTHQRELIRSIFSHLNLEILKRARPPTSTFNFTMASLGNLFLTGARLFTGSFESAIYLLGIMGGIPADVRVIPAINSNFSHHISAGLEDGSVITGQNAISHPSAPTALDGLNYEEEAPAEDANIPGTLPTLRRPNIVFSKCQEEELGSPIERIWYINPYGQEMRPTTNPKAIEALTNANAVIYSIGSLYTSIFPCLILKGVGEAIASSKTLKYKILILNGSLDRETGPSWNARTATDFVAAIARACEESRGESGYASRGTWGQYVTHVVHLEGEGTPKVDKRQLAQAGVQCVRVYGRTADEGGMRYDAKGLSQALEAILGTREAKRDRSRRNTLEH